MDLGVIITDRTLFHPGSGDVAHLAGYGPVPAEAVREQLRAITATPDPSGRDPFGADGPALRAVMRRLYTHPTTGELVSMDSRTRAFPPAMARFLTWRDTSCRGPFCNASVRHHDHIEPFSRGGPTSLDNGQDVCAHCNQKENDTVTVERIDDPELPGHRVAWTAWSGVTRTTMPTQFTADPSVRGPEQADHSVASGADDEAGRCEQNGDEDGGPEEQSGHEVDGPEEQSGHEADGPEVDDAEPFPP